MTRKTKYILTIIAVLLTGMYRLYADNITPSRPIELRTPENLGDGFVYNPLTDRYEYHSKIAGSDLTTPISLTRDEYLNYTLQKSMNAYFKEKNDEDSIGNKKKSFFDFDFDIGPGEKIFGPGGVKLRPQGSITTKMGVTHTISGDPTMTERQRNRWAFDFDPQIQATVGASIGDKMNFDMNYNTMSTFDYDTKKLKLAYAGKEDEIVKILEAGNVSMNTTNSLIQGGAALFGIKTQLQFGKLTVDAVFSQQNSQSRTTAAKGTVQTTPFEITADNYDENQHFFLAHYFPSIYDFAISKVPYIQSGILIEQGDIELWVTGKRVYDQARNIVAFADLGENQQISHPGLVTANPNPDGNPSNDANNLYSDLVNIYTGAREMSQVNQVLGAAGFIGGQDYEKIENARKLDASEYTFNPQLGYISLRMPLQSDEVLAVAFSYKYKGQVYTVGETSTNRPGNPKENLYLKLLKGTSQSPQSPSWNLMMKNIYTVNPRGVLSREKFRLDIKYQSDTTGVYMNYLTEGQIAKQMLLRVENLDRLNSREEPHADGFFDFVEGYTAYSQAGKIIFPSVQPFGNYLRKKFVEGAPNATEANKIADKYVYQELYDSTLTVARQAAEKNKFILTGEYQGSDGGGISLDGYNIAKGSVTVTADGVLLKENQDYTVNYQTGEVTVTNPMYVNSDKKITSENQSGLNMQRKTMMGLNLNYAFSKDFNIGGTIMNLSEMPMTMKTGPSEESINNTLFGFNTNFTTKSQWLTNMVDKLPLLDLTAPSQITFSAEYAQLIPGHYKSKYGGDYSYIDDFERSKITIDLRSPYSWSLSSTPQLFEESKLPVSNGIDKPAGNIGYGKNRALLAWYYIDGLFTRKSTLTPSHIKNDDEQLSNHYVREIREEELFPTKDVRYNESSTVPVLNLAYYPKERGPYNLDASTVNPDGTLQNPKDRWGGIVRKIENGSTDFEANNIETIEFWLLDPFIYNPASTGGELYFNLGEISEDVLKDEKKFFENGLPIDGDPTKVTETVWGYVPTQQSLTYAFDAQGDRKRQDVGFNGLSTEQEKEFPTYVNYLNELRNRLNPETFSKMQDDPFSPFNDPAGDNYHYFRGSDYDREQKSILDRYKHYNGTEGNSADANDSRESYNTAAKIGPDIEDINQDNTLNENEKYFQYRVKITPADLRVGDNFIVDKRVTRPKLKNGKTEEVTWYQFKIPVKNYTGQPIGNIRDFQSIRFMRMFMTGFADSTILRFGTLELVRGDWRIYTKDISNPNLPPAGNADIRLSTVSIEENGDKQPVNYIIPPGVNRMTDPGQPQLIMQNEQSLSAQIKDLEPGDARATYKNEHVDMRQYKKLQMFVHAEKLADAVDEVENDDLSVFLRLGSDYKNNYYEYEIPLKITPPGQYLDGSSADREIVWPRANMFNFPLEILTNLKQQRNKEKRKLGSEVTYYTPFSDYDPNLPMNKVTVVGNPTLSEVKVIMIGVRNQSRSKKSAEIWADELRLTEFNEEGGWAGNANLYVALSDLGSVNIAARKETAGFGALDQGLMQRNLDDKQLVNVSAQIEMGKFFPEKAKISLPVYYSYKEDKVSPKYNPLDQDILLKDALEVLETKSERDSLENLSIDKVVSRSFEMNNIRVGIKSKKSMPYDPDNFSLGYSFSENYTQNPTTEYDRETAQRLSAGYAYTPPFKPWKPFEKKKNKFLNSFQLGYLPKNIAFNSDMSRNYFEIQLRDLAGGVADDDFKLPVSFREDFYWHRTTNINWDLTQNIRLTFNNGTQARVDAPAVQVNKKLNLNDYELWKDSVMTSLMDFGSPLNYNQQFSATYQLPFKLIPALNFMSGDVAYNAKYIWQRGAEIEDVEQELGNVITSERTIGFNNFALTLTTLYNKSKFLSDVNKKFVLKKPAPASTARRAAAQKAADEAKKKETPAKKAKKYEGDVQLTDTAATTFTHSLNTKRIRLTARGANGKVYPVDYKVVDNNKIQIKNRDTVAVHVNVTTLPPLDDLTWYKMAQVAARGLMMVRSLSVTYTKTQNMTLPGFRPEAGDFMGQGTSDFGRAPGFDFAFGLIDQSYIDRAFDNDWLVTDNPNSTNPALFNNTENFNMTATLEPFVGMKINLNATRTSTAQNQVDFFEGNMSKRYSGMFNMTTISLSSAFETSNAANNYRSKAFDKFMENREVIVARLEKQYGQFSDRNGIVEPNSADVLIPAFLAAYTGKNPDKVGLSFFPSLLHLLPNWRATYDGFIQLPIISKYFRSFTLEHNYKSTYAVGSYNSYSNWEELSDGLGYIRSTTDNQMMFSSPYNVMGVSIVEAFEPLIRVNSTFLNNMSLKLDYTTRRTVNLNISSYQIVEMASKDFTAGVGYRISDFDKIIKFPKNQKTTFNNELRLSADVTYRMQQSINRKIQEAPQATSGDSQFIIKLTADYAMSKMITLQGFFDHQVSKPLVSATAFPQTKSAFGLSLKVSLQN